MNVTNILSTLGVLLFTITIIWAIAWLALRFQLVPGQKNRKNKNSNSELTIVETLTLDTKRRLIKVEDDGFEHLLLLGPTSETHIHSKKIIEKTKATTENKSEQELTKNNESLLKHESIKDKPLH